MKRFFCFLTGFCMICGFLNGCATSESEELPPTVEMGISAIESIFQTALSVAANILASEGTQQLAIAAAESYVASTIENPSQQQIINSIIESAIPELSEGIATVINSGVSVKTILKKDKVEITRSTYVESEQFQKLVKDCVKLYQKK